MWEIKLCNFICLGFQTVCAIYDIRVRAVPRWLLLVGSALAAAARIAGIGQGTWTYVWGGMLGVGFMLFSKYTDETLGYADSWMIFVLGIYMGIRKLAVSLCIAFLMAGIWGIGKITIQKKGRKEVFPFLPFLAVGYLGVIGW